MGRGIRTGEDNDARREPHPLLSQISTAAKSVLAVTCSVLPVLGAGRCEAGARPAGAPIFGTGRRRLVCHVAMRDAVAPNQALRSGSSVVVPVNGHPSLRRPNLRQARQGPQHGRRQFASVATRWRALRFQEPAFDLKRSEYALGCGSSPRRAWRSLPSGAVRYVQTAARRWSSTGTAPWAPSAAPTTRRVASPRGNRAHRAPAWRSRKRSSMRAALISEQSQVITPASRGADETQGEGRKWHKPSDAGSGVSVRP